MTDAEKKLWFHLRRRQMDGHRFRRQVPIGSYIADFACLSSRLIVELDGGQHSEEDGKALDAQRTEWLKTQGYRDLRFWNSAVLTETDSVTETIFNALSPSPARGRNGSGLKANSAPPPPALPLKGEE